MATPFSDISPAMSRWGISLSLPRKERAPSVRLKERDAKTNWPLTSSSFPFGAMEVNVPPRWKFPFHSDSRPRPFMVTFLGAETSRLSRRG